MINPHNADWEKWLQKWFLPLLIPAILINAGGLFIPILEPDGSLYATISKTIAQTGDFVNLRVEGKDWLDKPHFPFWMAALSMRIFGATAFAYKFPALLFWGAGAWYTYKFAFALYGKPVAELSTLIYVSAAHLVISNNDVRAEPYLTGLIIGAVYHFYKASRIKPGGHLVAGSIFAAGAAMTKGPFVLITIGAGFLLDWAVGRDWAQLRNQRWYIAVFLTALFTLPELICLYLQFDIHPEKLVFGHTGVSGIRFFFWDSQFGRFFNTGPIKGSGDPFFYFHTLLWAFLPWSLALYAAVIYKCRRVIRPAAENPGRRHTPGDLVCLGAASASFLVFSLSRFQLPHYLNILFPFFSILTAGYLYNVRLRLTQKTLRIIQDSISLLLPLLLLLLGWFFHFNGWLWLLIVILALSIVPWLLFRGRSLPAAVSRSLWMALLVFAFVNFIVYPSILRYQAGTQAGHSLPAGDAAVFLLQEAPVNYSFEFDSPRPVERIPIDSLFDKKDALVFAPAAFADTLAKRGYKTDIIRKYPNFHISQLTGPFVNYKTRESVIQWYAVFKVNRQAGRIFAFLEQNTSYEHPDLHHLRLSFCHRGSP